MTGDTVYPWGIRPRAEALFIIGIVLSAIIALGDFTILGHDFGTDSWKSQYPWANEYKLKDVRTVNYDAILEHRPWFELARTELMAGRIPLWNPYSFCGTPLYANHLCPVLYPPLTIALLLFDEDRIAGWLAVLHLIIFGICIYGLLRTFGIHPWPAFLIACASQYTGACFVLWHPWAAAVAWSPAVLAFYERYRLTRDIRNLAYAALIYGIMSMAAFPVIAVHFTYLLFAYIVIRETTGSARKPTLIIPSFLGILLLGFLISGVQNIPTAFYSADTYRSIKYEHSMAFLDPPPPPAAMEPERPENLSPKVRWALARGRFVAPVSRLRILDNRNYIGAAIFIFALSGLFVLPRGRRHWLYIFIILFAISYYDPLYMFLMKTLPLWKMRMYEPKEMWQLSALVCAGFGLQALLEHKDNLLTPLARLALIVIAILVGIYSGLITKMNFSAAAGMYSLNLVPDLPTIVLYIIGIALILHSLIHLIIRSKPPRAIHKYLLLIAIIVSGVSGRLIALPYTSDVEILTPPQTEFTRFLEKTTGPDHRIARITSEKYWLNFLKRTKLPFLANLSTMYTIRDVSGYDSFITQRTVDYLNLVEDYSVQSLRAHLSFTNPGVLQTDMFRAMGVSTVISDMPVLAGTSDAKRFGDIYVHTIANPAPRYYFARDVKIVDSREKIAPLLMHNGWLDGRVAFIDGSMLTPGERDALGISNPPGIEASTIAPLGEKLRSVAFEVDTVSPSLLVLNDAYAPGWVVRIDGAKGKCLNANMLFRAAYVPRGKHVVEFSYEPSYMAWGWFSTAIGLIAFLLILINVKPSRQDI